MKFSSVLASALASAFAIVAIAGCTRGSQPSDTELGTQANWTAPGGTADESGYSGVTEIDTGNVDRLGLAWSLDLAGEVTLEATPLAVDGVLYFSGGRAAVYAVDALSGELRWKYDPESWKRRPDKITFGANRGVAYEDGRVFVATMDARLIALDARTGKELWHADTIPEGMLHNSSGAPRTMNGKVIIGNAGADFGARGFVTAYDSATGRFLWRFFTVPGSPEENRGDPIMEAAARTWGGEYWKTGTGGTVWNGMTFDPERNRVYIGVGNAGPYDPSVRSPGGGDNLYVASIVALDADTGKYIWHYQENPRDAWDYKAAPNIIAATLVLDGEPRKVLLHSPTNGFFYVLDRETGKLISAEKTGKVNWAERIDLETGRPVENPGIRYEDGPAEIWPGALGTHNWQAMSYSPRTGLVYIPYMQMGTRFSKGPPIPGATALFGLNLEPIIEDDEDGKGKLLAWDPVAQKARWSVQHDHIWNGGTLATAGDLVFQGTADGWFSAYSARDGRRLWRFYAGLGIIAAPMSYAVNGKQYVSILVGYGGSTAALGDIMNVGWKYGAQPRRLLNFVLDGKAQLPPTAPPDMTLNALDDPALVLDEADVRAGEANFIRCFACHGIALQSTGSPGPDLRESAIALHLDSFSQLVRSGALMSRGMPGFDTLTDEQIRQIHAYIRAGAREALGKRPASTSKGAPPAL